MKSCRRYLLLAAVVVLEVFGRHSCSANKHCNSSCGDISIRLPFRLRTDPESCGYKFFELDCEDNQKAVLYLSSYAKYYVREINYTGFSIRIVDTGIQKDNCSSLPRHPLTEDLLDSSNKSKLFLKYAEDLVFVRCATPVALDVIQHKALLEDYNHVQYVDSSSCVNGTHYNYSSSHSLKGEYSYIIVGSHLRVSDLKDSCRVEMRMLSSALNRESWLSKRSGLTYKDVHDSLLFGFQFCFHYFCCHNYDIYNPCNFEGDRQRCYVPTLIIGTKGFLGPILRIVDKVATFLESSLSYLHKFGKLYRTPMDEGKSYDISEYDDSDPRYWISWLFAKNVLPRNYHQLRYDGTDHQWETNESDPRYWIYRLFSVVLHSFIDYHILLFIFGGPFVLGFLIYKWRRRHLSVFDNIEKFLQTQGDFMPIRYSYYDIKKMTKNFKDKLGQGGYGSVYKGRLRSGRLAAIKLLGNFKANGQDFINEVGTIGTIYHVNVVKLIGFCVQGPKRALVYEFMPNGSLDKYLFSPEVNNSISIEKMYEISLGVARGIEYLHRGCAMQILHFDIKPHNILLDENFTPKVSDFGIAKLCKTKNAIISLTGARGTIGYMAPELCYRHIGGVSFKADVYSFGMLLMEMVGRRKNLNEVADHSSQIYFPAWAYEQFRKGKFTEFGEVNATEEQNKITKKIIVVALWCIQLKPENRPPMHKVIEMLEQDVECLELPLRLLLSSKVVEDKDTEIEEHLIEIRDSESNSNSISLIVDAK